MMKGMKEFVKNLVLQVKGTFEEDRKYSVRPLINDFLRKMAKFRHQENQDVSAGTRIRLNITVRQSRQSGVARATCPD